MCCSAAAARATRPHAQPARHHCGHTALERNRPTVRVHVGVRAWNEIVHACVWGRGGATASAHVCLCVWACNCKCTCAVCGAGSGGSTGRLPAAAYGGAGRPYGSGGRRVDLSLDGHAPAEVEEVELKHRIAEPALSQRSREQPKRTLFPQGDTAVRADAHFCCSLATASPSSYLSANQIDLRPQ